MISINSLSKNFDQLQVLSNINLELHRGEVVGIVGANGAGKTTLFKCIAGLCSYEGFVISEINPLKNQLGLLLSEQHYFEKITGREYLTLLLLAREIFEIDIDRKNIFDLPLDVFVYTYSTGMKKKLALMGTLLQNNEAYIFDEPFNGVDIQSNMIITEIIHELKRKNKMVLISSHIFSTLSDTCDKIYILENSSLSRCIEKNQFSQLESEMKKLTLGDSIERLGIK